MILDRWKIVPFHRTKIYQDQLLLENANIVHGFSTRLGGASSGHFNSLNLALHVGDSAENVNKNRDIFSNALGIEKKSWVALNQIHSDYVIKVSQQDRGKGSENLKEVVGDGDAMITDHRLTPLVTFYADCIPLYIVDNVNKAIGLAHAGWKGTFAQIGTKTLHQMRKNYGTKPEDCQVAIGPGIGSCCYQVGPQIIDLCEENYPNAATNNTIDLKKINWLQFIRSGVLKENISVSSLCTKCNQDIFYSYRGGQSHAGRMAAVLMIK